MRRPGISVIEVIIALGMAAIVIAAVGNLTAATHRLTSSTGQEIEATAYAKQWLEIISAQANQQFGCSCTTSGTCVTPPTCVRTSDSQACTYRQAAGFNSCWTAPLNTAPFSFSGTGPWTATDAPAAGFTRTMTITNLQRDANGVLVSSGGTVDPNTKQIAVSVTWSTGHTQLSSILTAWKNF